MYIHAHTDTHNFIELSRWASSQTAVRTDGEMKLLLQTMQTPHFVHASDTHGEHNCLIDSMLLALSSIGMARSLTEEQRARLCHETRDYLVTHHDVPPGGPDGFPFLSHEDHG